MCLRFRTDRVTRNDIVINGLHIPKGMVIGIPIYSLQNDPEIWQNPEKFDPDRSVFMYFALLQII